MDATREADKNSQEANDQADDDVGQFPAYVVVSRQGATSDALMADAPAFDQLGINEDILNALKVIGYERPSPIQAKAIPSVLQGHDCILQSKAGTGKTCVICVASLQRICVDVKAPQVLILTSSSEISIQIYCTMVEMAQFMKGVCCRYAVGGTNLEQDKRFLKGAQIIVGTVGRIAQLLESDAFDASLVRLLILDEIDKLHEGNMLIGLHSICNCLPTQRQTVTLSTTSLRNIHDSVTPMNDPQVLRLNVDDHQLIGVKSFTMVNCVDGVSIMQNKLNAVVYLLKSIDYEQCIIFSNYQARANEVGTLLRNEGITLENIDSVVPLTKRIHTLKLVRMRRVNVLVATDLISRGVDLPAVDLVINFDIPEDYSLYLHRLGRCGRFGTYGAAVNLLCCKGEADIFCAMALENNVKFKVLDRSLPNDLIKNGAAQEALPGFVYDRSAADYLWLLLLSMNANVRRAPRAAPARCPKATADKAKPSARTAISTREFLTDFCESDDDDDDDDESADSDCTERRLYGRKTLKAILKDLLKRKLPKIRLACETNFPCAVKQALNATEDDKAQTSQNDIVSSKPANSVKSKSENPVNALEGYVGRTSTGEINETVETMKAVSLENKNSPNRVEKTVDDLQEQNSIGAHSADDVVVSERKDEEALSLSASYGDHMRRWVAQMERHERLIVRYESMLDQWKHERDQCAPTLSADVIDVKEYVDHMANFFKRNENSSNQPN